MQPLFKVFGQNVAAVREDIYVGVFGLTWQYIFISVFLDILLPLSHVGGVDLLRPVFS